eukprot:COSAG06_NODE_46817_length_344_cov_0.628571_1_plen_47_part_01
MICQDRLGTNVKQTLKIEDRASHRNKDLATVLDLPAKIGDEVRKRPC